MIRENNLYTALYKRMCRGLFWKCQKRDVFFKICLSDFITSCKKSSLFFISSFYDWTLFSFQHEKISLVNWELPFKFNIFIKHCTQKKSGKVRSSQVYKSCLIIVRRENWELYVKFFIFYKFKHLNYLLPINLKALTFAYLPVTVAS